jgi:uncharacterized protein YfaS (alpha-2-macroglobulin family)
MASILSRLGLRPASAALVVIVSGAACLQGARAPRVAPRGTLGLEAPNGGAADDTKALAIVFGAPKGQTVDPSEISLVFNRPMRALDLAGGEAPSPAVLTPAVKGRWQWVGTSALQFVPEGQLPRATSFSVDVPADARALDGSTLGKPYKLSFSTALPALVRTTPHEQDDDLGPAQVFELKFNQPIADAELRRAVTLTAKDSAVAFDVRRDEPSAGNLATLVPKQKLPLDAPIRLTIDASLRGTEGPLPAGVERTLDYHTYGPLVVAGLDCDRYAPGEKCSAEHGMTLRLSNAVKFADLKRAISIEPAVKPIWPSWIEDDQPVNSLSILGRFRPAKSYAVRLNGAGLRDEHGQPLGRDWRGSVEFGDYWPTAEIGVYGTYLEPTARKKIPIATVNVPTFELVTAPLDEGAVLGLGSSYQDPEFASLTGLPGARAREVAPSGARNAAASHLIDPADVLGASKRGPLVIGIRYMDRPGTQAERPMTQQRVIQVTDLAITAKLSMHGTLVWVSRLSTGAPVAGASVSIRGPSASTSLFRTDAQGLAKVPLESFRPNVSGQEESVIFARTDDDFAYRRVESQLDGYRYGAPVQMEPAHPFGMIFSDRGIYRPGDTVRLKGILRMEAHPRTVTPVGRGVNVKVHAAGVTIAEASPKLSAFGTFAIDVKVPEGGKLGTYEVDASVEGSGRGWADVSSTFEVAEYRAAEFEVGVESDRPSYVRGDTASWVGRGDFLFGAPMADANANLRVTRAPGDFTPPNADELTTSDEAYWSDLPNASPNQSELANSDAKLDARGLTALSAALAMPGQKRPEQLTCEVSVADLSRQQLSGSTTAIVHPAEFYLGVDRGGDAFAAAGQVLKPRIAAIDPKGKRVASVPVKVELIQRRWQVAKQTSAGGGGLHSVVSAVDTVAAACQVTTAAQAASCELRLPTAGYFLVRATAADRRKNPVGASVGLYAIGEGEIGWADTDDSSIELVADKKSYEVGQTAKILVKSPFKSADALVTVERAGTYSERRMTLSGATPTIEVPITEDLRPNAYVSVLLLRGRSKPIEKSGTKADVGAPTFRMGYTSLRINPEARRLSVKVQPNKSDYRPGEKTDVVVSVRDREGKPARAELTLYAVDEGVLSLIGYKTPDPIAVFGAPRPLQVATIEARASLARVQDPLAALGIDKGQDGGGGGMMGLSVRRDFRASAFWAAALVTDGEGQVKASFKLPDSLTTYRVMAVATAEDDRFGFGQERITASRSLMARPAFPRVLRAGDTLEAGVIVTSKGLGATKVNVDLKVEGIAAKELRRTIELPASGSAEVRFPLVAASVGEAKLRFHVEASGHQDTVEITRKILAPLVPEAVAVYGDTTTASAERLGDLSAMRSDYGGLDIRLASTALVGLDSGIDQLVEYPYGCTEQLTSRLVPLLPLRDLARDYQLKLPADVDRVVATTVGKIAKAQRPDGSFGFWADSPDASVWVTTYALWGLSTAKRHGAAVPADTLDGATRYVKRQLERLSSPLDRAAMPFILDVLAENGAPDPGRVSRVFDDREDLPLFAKALLLHAMVLSKADRASVDALMSELEGHLRLDGPTARAVENTGSRYATLMDSSVRTSALVLRALIAAKPSHPLAAKLAMGLLADRRGGTWRSTQETAWALLALDDYRRAQEKVAPDFDANVFLGETLLFSAPFHGRTTAQAQGQVPAARLTSATDALLAFAVEGRGKLFYEGRLRYSRKELPRTELDRGFFVQKTLRAVNAKDLEQAVLTLPESSATKFLGGDLVLADLIVVTPSPRNFVVLDDPLPAGFEAVDVRLATTGASLDVDAASARAQRAQDDEGSPDTAWFLREVRDDRVLFFIDHMPAGMYHYRYLARATSLGQFVVPPARAEEMYVPEVFGRTAASSVDVTATP